MTVEHGCDKRI